MQLLEALMPTLHPVKCFVGVCAILAFVSTAGSAQPGSVDSTFNPNLNFGGVVYAIALQTNGQVLIGGAFSSIGGVPITNVARLNSNGTLDSTFNPGNAADSGYVSTLAIQNDGKLLLGGFFASSSGAKPAFLTRLNSDGSSDPSFNQFLYLDGAVNALAVQPDQEILLAGDFNFIGGYSRRSLARLYADGDVDASFDACVGSSSGSGATSLAILSDWKILVTGRFFFSTGHFRDGVARLESCGNLDPTYAQPPGVNPGATVYSLALRNSGDALGDALIGGNFTNYYNQPLGGVVLLTTNGTPDIAFNPGSGINSTGTVYALALQNDGKIIIGGEFTRYNEQPCVRLARLNRNGSLDTLFNAGAGPNNSVGSIVVQPDGKILVGGTFTTFNGFARTAIARLHGGPLPFWLTPPTRFGPGGVQMRLFGEPQASYAVQTSSNLANWPLLTNITLATNSALITDSQPGPTRYYRAIYLP